MKKKIITLSLALVMLVLALAILTVLPTALQGERDPLPPIEIGGRMIFDAGGNLLFCDPPGTGCTVII